ncbi:MULTISPECIES: GntR family transcriptional regulator [Microbacterium]|uniref:DNA-binding transcriptional regulator, GntR family n=1 Tax=Microbacterium saccharophilum TaxID=1213358 RepID=A0A7Z7D2A5_9MICO|nr:MULTISPECIES: GntR family transcriptional regulator [Microbacterium]SFI61529.1 DNA-binding transcriptional regulator, GntR family [Microbacterium saccharophilum]
MPTKQAHTAAGTSVHDAIRADILRGVHAPGAPLRLAALARQFDVSMWVIREALVRLSEQHLAVRSTNQGFRVVSISKEDLLDLTEVRVMIEGRALVDSIQRGNIDWEASVVSAHHVLEHAEETREGQPGSTVEWSLAHERFHDTLIAACGSPRLATIARNLRASAEVYLQLSADATSTTHERDPRSEHHQLMELAITRRSDDARSAIENHIRLTTELVLRAPIPAAGR